MATRTAVDEANVVMAVGSMSMKGLHSLTRLLADLNEHGVPVERVVPVFNLAHRSPRQRATYSAALADLTRWRAELAAAKGATASPPVFVPVRAIDAALRDGARLPDLLVRPLAAGASLVLRPRDGASDTRRKSPFMRVVPGTLGSWSTEHDDLDDEQGAVG